MRARPGLGAHLGWLLAGALISSGVVGYLTGLLLVPFGLVLTVCCARWYRSAWPTFLVGLGLGPVTLLIDDLATSDQRWWSVALFSIGLILMALGLLLDSRRVAHGR
jgi:hypothetical protein